MEIKSKQINLRMKPSRYKKLEKIAEKFDVTISELIRKSMEKVIEANV